MYVGFVVPVGAGVPHRDDDRDGRDPGERGTHAQDRTDRQRSEQSSDQRPAGTTADRDDRRAPDPEGAPAVVACGWRSSATLAADAVTRCNVLSVVAQHGAAERQDLQDPVVGHPVEHVGMLTTSNDESAPTQARQVI